MIADQSVTLTEELELQLFNIGYRITKDIQTDYFRYSAKFWVEDSGLFDTPEEAALALIQIHQSN